jgi:hypothetical protein
LTVSNVKGTSIALSTIGVDLTGRPGEILAEARRAADCLIAAASAPRLALAA